MINVSHVFYVDPFVQTTIHVGCVAGCENHTLKIQKWIDEIDTKAPITFLWRFKEGTGFPFKERFMRAWRYLFQYKRWTKYCDSVIVEVGQMRRLHDLAREVAVPLLDLELPKITVKDNAKFSLLCYASQEDPKLVVRRYKDENMYEIGYEYIELTGFKDRFEKAWDYVFGNQFRYELNDSEVMMDEVEILGQHTGLGFGECR